MNVLVIGSGGREHALCWKIAASPLVQKLYCAPGNGGISQVAECVALNPLDFDGIVRFCRDHDIGFVVVGPEDPLVNGLVDRLDREGIKSFGPNAAAASASALRRMAWAISATLESWAILATSATCGALATTPRRARS